MRSFPLEQQKKKSVWPTIKCPYFPLSRKNALSIACPQQSLCDWELLPSKSGTSVSSGVLPNTDQCSLHWGGVAETSGSIRLNANRGNIRLYNGGVALKHHLGLTLILLQKYVRVVKTHRRRQCCSSLWLSTVIYVPAYEGSAFFTGRLVSLLDRCCRFLPASSPYPRGSQPTAPWQVLNTSS